MSKIPPIDPLVAAALAREIPSLIQQREALDAQIAHLQSTLAAVNWKISTYKAAAGDKSQPPPSPKVVEALSAMGFRDVIRKVLRESPSGLSPRQVAERLLATGYKYTGKTNINLRVSNDLHRLFNRGQVSRKGKLYALREAGGSAGDEMKAALQLI